MRIALIGVGMGDGETMTLAAAKRFREADVVLGAERLLASVPCGPQAHKLALALPAKIADAVRANSQWENVCVALSGDVGFYSGAKRLLELLHEYEPELICGVSTVQYFAARLACPWQSFHLVSAHGTECDVLAEVLNHRETMFLTGGAIAVRDIIDALRLAGLGAALVAVGENLSAPEERIVRGTVDELGGRDFAPLSVVLVENDRTFTRESVAAGIEDEAFLRGDAPMTKREVRAMALSLLSPAAGATLYDIGAGTGSVAVEMALLARRGRVYAVEREAGSRELIESNKERFGVYNMHIVAGTAPDALASLPPPDAAFIGGSGGKMREIVAALLERNPTVRIVASAVTLESLAAAVESMTELGMRNVEATQIAATRTVSRGGYRMFNAMNPVFLIGGGGPHVP